MIRLSTVVALADVFLHLIIEKPLSAYESLKIVRGFKAVYRNLFAA